VVAKALMLILKFALFIIQIKTYFLEIGMVKSLTGGHTNIQTGVPFQMLKLKDRWTKDGKANEQTDRRKVRLDEQADRTKGSR
jgi:hypothetical protein